MISYDYESESWKDSDDVKFEMLMTPECQKDCELIFETQDDFYDWFFLGELK